MQLWILERLRISHCVGGMDMRVTSPEDFGKAPGKLSLDNLLPVQHLPFSYKNDCPFLTKLMTSSILVNELYQIKPVITEHIEST